MKEDHFLRPALTKLLIQRLERGDSLNIHGNSGIGKTRLLEDIKTAGLKDALVVHVSLKVYWKSRDGFFNALWRECGIYGETPGEFSEIIDRLKQENNRVFLLIDDFHYLFDNADIDAKYDQGFLDSINSVKNTAGVSLLAVTRKPANGSLIFIDKQPMTSSLNLQAIPVDSLSYSDMKRETARRFTDDLTGEQLEKLAFFLSERPENYAMMINFEQKIKTGSANYPDFPSTLKG